MNRWKICENGLDKEAWAQRNSQEYSNSHSQCFCFQDIHNNSTDLSPAHYSSTNLKSKLNRKSTIKTSLSQARINQKVKSRDEKYRQFVHQPLTGQSKIKKISYQQMCAKMEVGQVRIAGPSQQFIGYGKPVIVPNRVYNNIQNNNKNNNNINISNNINNYLPSHAPSKLPVQVPNYNKQVSQAYCTYPNVLKIVQTNPKRPIHVPMNPSQINGYGHRHANEHQMNGFMGGAGVVQGNVPGSPVCNRVKTMKSNESKLSYMTPSTSVKSTYYHTVRKESLQGVSYNNGNILNLSNAQGNSQFPQQLKPISNPNIVKINTTNRNPIIDRNNSTSNMNQTSHDSLPNQLKLLHKMPNKMNSLQYQTNNSNKILQKLEVDSQLELSQEVSKSMDYRQGGVVMGSNKGINNMKSPNNSKSNSINSNNYQINIHQNPSNISGQLDSSNSNTNLKQIKNSNMKNSTKINTSIKNNSIHNSSAEGSVSGSGVKKIKKSLSNKNKCSGSLQQKDSNSLGSHSQNNGSVNHDVNGDANNIIISINDNVNSKLNSFNEQIKDKDMEIDKNQVVGSASLPLLTPQWQRQQNQKKQKNLSQIQCIKAVSIANSVRSQDEYSLVLESKMEKSFNSQHQNVNDNNDNQGQQIV